MIDNIQKYTWFKTGGKAKEILQIYSIEELQNFLKNNKEKYYILGAGSNVIMSDEGFNGVIIRTQSFLRKIQLLDPYTIEVQAGVSDLTCANFAANNNISGLEFLCTIPGTIGGAIKMNAGCFKKEVKDILVNVTCLTNKGEIVVLNNQDCHFAYRYSSIPENWIIISGIFQGNQGDSNIIIEYMDKMFEIKNSTQPIGVPSVGSVFKNPPNTQAWVLIDLAGFRGFKHKSVMVSDKHTNFILHNPDYINIKSQDFIELTEIIKEKVLKDFNILLSLEVQIIDY
jgi:UDP-N-acetylmuramate dehydrogenase